jgi:BirA family transcriptional regulator, biotin operon repressor / biotin---[acetyl-CoA-carboxylase] ligase
MPLSSENLQSFLAPRPFQYHESVDSTNDLASEWLKSGAPHGAVVIANEQLKGRGRLGRVWHTPPNVAVAMSVILKPNKNVVGRVSLLGALSISDVCERYGLDDVSIKWPNDVQIEGKKVCGILPEAVWQQDHLLGVVLGIGVNVRVRFDEELAPLATNLESRLGFTINRAELIMNIVKQLDFWFPKLESDEFLRAWKLKLNTLNRQVTVGEITGIATDIDNEGALLVQTETQGIQRVIAGDILLGDNAL